MSKGTTLDTLRERGFLQQVTYYVGIDPTSGQPLDELPTHFLTESTSLVTVLVATALAKTRSEARRLIAGGGVKVGDTKVEDIELVLILTSLPESGIIVHVGKKHAVRVARHG